MLCSQRLTNVKTCWHHLKKLDFLLLRRLQTYKVKNLLSAHFLKFRIVLEAHTASVLVLLVLDLLPSCSNSWKAGVSRAGTT